MQIRTSIITLTAAALAFAASTGTADETPITPTTTLQTVRGMAHTVSAEGLGAGRLSVSLLGTWYKQSNEYLSAPPGGSSVLTGLGGFSFGASDYIDLFAVLPMYFVFKPDGEVNVGLGSLCAGVLGTVPLPAQSPLRLGGQVAIIAGTSGDQINTNAEDGYNYLETRTGFDFVGKLMQSLVLGKESLGFKLHLNQGIVVPLGQDHNTQLLLSGGIQVPVHKTVVLGVEVNTRTGLADFSLSTDPFWVTPCIHVRAPRYVSLMLGADISLSQSREADSVDLAIEPLRLFGGVTLSFDALGRKRTAAAEKERTQQMQKQEAERRAAEAQARADSIAIADAQTREVERLRADSLTQKLRQDSIALAETKARLATEIEKRSDAEKQLLSTGLLLLDAVYFASGRAVIEMNSKPYLKIIARMLTKYPKLQIENAGHTDNTGRMENNMILSQERARTVQQFLVDIAPELNDRLVARGYGPMQPKADNRTADGRKSNRRVELQVTNKDALKEYNP